MDAVCLREDSAMVEFNGLASGRVCCLNAFCSCDLTDMINVAQESLSEMQSYQSLES